VTELAIDPALPPGLPVDAAGTAITVGTFDGLHRGHLAVLRRLTASAAEHGRRSALVTFHPHPLQVLNPDAAPRLLTLPAEKKEILAETGLDYVVFLPFTSALAAYSPERFVDELLIGRFGMKELVMGYDHGFGQGRSGTPETLRLLGLQRGFPVEVVAPVILRDGPISSTRIRRALESGDVLSAAEGLGRPYALQGVVVRGAGLGRGLGFPTANLQFGDPAKLLPLEGIYAVRGRARDAVWDGVMHLGPRPTFQGLPPSVELHFFGVDRELYGERLRVEFCARIRGIARFDTAAALVAAMKQDRDAARAVLEQGGGACQIRGEALDSTA
jgi:riboflavin kinase / FMN adenylyltransferase